MRRPYLPRSLLVLIVVLALLLSLSLRIATHPLAALRWLPPEATRHEALKEETPPHIPTPADMQRVWEHPIFSPDRQPDPPLLSNSDEAMDGYSLQGLIGTHQVMVALLRSPEGKTLRLHVGDALPNGWSLSAIAGDRATLTNEERAVSLRLQRPRLPDHPSTHKRLPEGAVTLKPQDP